MTRLNAQLVNLLVYVIFVYKAGNAIHAKNLKISAENAQTNAFVMQIFFKKNIVSLWLRSTIFNIKKLVFIYLV